MFTRCIIPDAIYTGLKDLLLSGFLSADYAQLIHDDVNDCGPTVGLRFTDTDPDAPSAYHLVQPTLRCEGKRGLVLHQQAGCLTVFLASRILHTSSLNEHGANPDYPSLSIGFVQKTKVLRESERKAHLLGNMVCFPILERFYSL